MLHKKNSLFNEKSFFDKFIYRLFDAYQTFSDIRSMNICENKFFD